MTIGTELIQAERIRQIESEGWSAAHDDEYDKSELALVACCYASPVRLYEIKNFGFNSILFQDPYPSDWSRNWDKRLSFDTNKKDDTENILVPDPETYSEEQRLDLLVKAGALIAAEIDLFGRKYEKIIQPYYHKMKSITRSESPFCEACKEEQCCVDPDGTCEMIRIYLKGKNNNPSVRA